MAPSADVRLPDIGASARVAKTVTEGDVSLFAGLTLDIAPQHLDEAFMSGHPYGRRVAHGTYVLGLASAAAARLSEQEGITTVSYGYDRVRFVRPAFIGDTVTATATVAEVVAPRTYLDVVATNQHGDVLAVARHVLHHPGDVPT